MKPSTVFGLLALLVLTGCTTTSRTPQATGTAPNLEALPGYQFLSDDTAVETARERLMVFASDEMEGRGTATPGARKAAAYLVGHLERMGVQPAGDVTEDGRSYFQRFDVRTIDVDRTATRLIDPADRLGAARFGHDWFFFPTSAPNVELTPQDIVFAGYGLTAPAQNYDDYADLDVQGRLVVVLPGKPAGVDKVLTPQGEVDAAGITPKLINAIQHGAGGIIFAGFPQMEENWEVYSALVRSTSMQLASTPAGGTAPLPFLFTSEAFGRRLLTAMGLSSELIAAAATGQALPPRVTNLALGLRTKIDRGTAEARNVVGYLPGHTKPEEFVAFGAHYDHNGIIDGVIYNGADDDGSGTIAVLNAAEAFTRDLAAGYPTDRSLLFVFHTGEEKGLLGSDVFTSQPERSVLDSIRQVVAQINVDMIGREHPDSLYIVGATRLSQAFGRRVDAVNQRLGEGGAPLFHFNRELDAPGHPENIYERSDHFNYARFGVPIVFFTDGMGANWRKGDPTDNYHAPEDDPEKIDYQKMARATRLMYAIGRLTADAPTAPALDQPFDAATATQ